MQDVDILLKMELNVLLQYFILHEALLVTVHNQEEYCFHLFPCYSMLTNMSHTCTMYSLCRIITRRQVSTVCLKVILFQTEQPLLCLSDKVEDKTRESRGGKWRKREIKRQAERRRKRGVQSDRTERGRVKSFKLFFLLNNPSFVQI